MNHKDKDMHLPVWICGLGIVLLIATVVLIVFAWLATIYCLIAAVVLPWVWSICYSLLEKSVEYDDR